MSKEEKQILLESVSLGNKDENDALKVPLLAVCEVAF